MQTQEMLLAHQSFFPEATDVFNLFYGIGPQYSLWTTREIWRPCGARRGRGRGAAGTEGRDIELKPICKVIPPHQMPLPWALCKYGPKALPLLVPVVSWKGAVLPFASLASAVDSTAERAAFASRVPELTGLSFGGKCNSALSACSAGLTLCRGVRSPLSIASRNFLE